MKPWNHRRNADMEGHNGSRKEDFWNGILWCFLHKKKQVIHSIRDLLEGWLGDLLDSWLNDLIW